MTRGDEDLVYDLLFQYPLGLAIFLLGLALFFPASRQLKRTVPLLALLFFGVNAHAQDDVTLTRQAQGYFSAGEYSRALELFRKLEGEKLAPWQHQRVLYNIGTSIQSEGSLA